MVQGFERREVIDSVLSRPTNLDAGRVPLIPPSRPQPSSMSHIGDSERQLAKVIGQASIGLSSYIEKKSEEWKLEGMMDRASADTEAEIAKGGNLFTRQGWQIMNTKLAGDELYHNELAAIQETNKIMTPVEFKSHLSSKYKELAATVPRGNNDARAMLGAWATDTYPKLVSEQVRQHNEYNRNQTKDMARKNLVSTAATDGEDAVKSILDPKYHNLSQDDYNAVVAAAVQDEVALGSKTIATALIKQSDAPVKTAEVPELTKTAAVLDMVRAGESNSNYNAVFGGEEPRLSSMSLDEVLQMQSAQKASGKVSTAAGAYQIKYSTLLGLKDKLKLTGQETFSEDLQDRLATVLLSGRGYEEFLSGRISAEEFQSNLSQEWAAIPKDKSGLSYYHKDGLNKATVQPGAVTSALDASASDTKLYSKLVSMGMKSDDISRVMKSTDALQRENSSKFNAARLLAEQDLIKSGVDLSDDDLIKNIADARDAGGYSDEWANGVFSSAIKAREVDLKERKKTGRLHTLIASNNVLTASKEDQQKAIDIVSSQALSANPDAYDPNSPNQATAQKQVQDQVFQFMYANQITDSRLTSMWESATMGDIIDAQGKIKPAALNAYSSYLQAKSSVNDPMFAMSLVGDRTKDLFILADSYRGTEDQASASDALAIASATLDKQNAAKGTNNLPWWNNVEKTRKLEDKLRDATIPGLLRGFGVGRKEAQYIDDIDTDAVERAALSSDVVARTKQETASLWSQLKHMPDEAVAHKLAVSKAIHKVLPKYEFVAGSYVYSKDTPTIGERIGMKGINNGANYVVTEVLGAVGEDVWGSDYGHLKMVPGDTKVREGIVNTSVDWIKGNILSGKTSEQRRRKNSEFDVLQSVKGNALIVRPYLNRDRNLLGPQLIIPIEALKEAAEPLRTGNREAFDAWVSEFKKTIPTYKDIK